MASSSVNYIGRSGNVGSHGSAGPDTKSLAFDIPSVGTGLYSTNNKFIQIPQGEPSTVPLDKLVSQLNKTVFLPDANQTHPHILETYSNYYNRITKS